LDDDRSDGGGGERALDLALDIGWGLVSAPAGLSGKLTWVEWIELSDGAEGGTRAGSCVAASTKATGCATTGDGADAP
jgi:hypothetical protein